MLFSCYYVIIVLYGVAGDHLAGCVPHCGVMVGSPGPYCLLHCHQHGAVLHQVLEAHRGFVVCQLRQPAALLHIHQGVLMPSCVLCKKCMVSVILCSTSQSLVPHHHSVHVTAGGFIAWGLAPVSCNCLLPNTMPVDAQHDLF